MTKASAMRARSWTAALLALALAVAGVPSAASAAGEASISGKVVIPAGLSSSDFRVRAYLGTTWIPIYGDLQEDGRFTVEGLDSGSSYRLYLD